MAGIKDKVGRFKDWMVPDEDGTEEGYENDAYEEETYYDNEEDEIEEEEVDDMHSTAIDSRMVNYHSSSQMKVVIVEPRIYDDAPVVADHLRMKKTVVVNLEQLTDQKVKKSIFDFMNGAVYVLDASIQRVSKSIFILAPKNVEVDGNVKKELESKAIFPWQTN